MDTPYLKSYYRRGSTFLSSKQIETIRTLKGKVPKYRIIRDFHINENRVNDIWESHERQQQIIQNTISSEILPISTILPEHSNRIESEVLLQGKALGGESELRQRLEAQLPRDPASSLNHVSSNLHLESITPLNTEIKKRSSKSRSKFMRISDPISSDNVDSTEKISGGGINNISNTDIVAQIEREIKRKDKNLASSARIMSTT
ncbi:6553_t:CDS:1 [Entrophospora sp. SA101]|nr:15534_t:CDS:1 [Entrophospora sp. SA101]CAJ0764101.1 6553_t:CDS:1 [Entrophospora sp. SA101]CAJ0831505.1 9975_t:CDS:1 [Entrophospora sp. SA101]CAJ0872617.1 1290_t:CDS:1 [Entrophospora sp. SA101]CAJ0886088.1 497_t:CDS:1 [Entrophospora sp. SA101]